MIKEKLEQTYFYCVLLKKSESKTFADMYIFFRYFLIYRENTFSSSRCLCPGSFFRFSIRGFQMGGSKNEKYFWPLVDFRRDSFKSKYEFTSYLITEESKRTILNEHMIIQAKFEDRTIIKISCHQER